jgi:hypothetical protein
MPNLFLVCGLPASGKTHVCNCLLERYPEAAYISTDDQFPKDAETGLRYWTDDRGRRKTWGNDPITVPVLVKAFQGVLAQLFDHIEINTGTIIVEDLFESRLKRIFPIMLASWYGYDVEIIHCNTSLTHCQERNEHRENRVPKEVLFLLNMSFLPPESDEAPVIIAPYGVLPEECSDCHLGPAS